MTEIDAFFDEAIEHLKRLRSEALEEAEKARERAEFWKAAGSLMDDQSMRYEKALQMFNPFLALNLFFEEALKKGANLRAEDLEDVRDDLNELFEAFNERVELAKERGFFDKRDEDLIEKIKNLKVEGKKTLKEIISAILEKIEEKREQKRQENLNPIYREGGEGAIQ